MGEGEINALSEICPVFIDQEGRIKHILNLSFCLLIHPGSFQTCSGSEFPLCATSCTFTSCFILLFLIGLFFYSTFPGEPRGAQQCPNPLDITHPCPQSPLCPCPGSGLGGQAGFGSQRVWAVICIRETQFLPGSTPFSLQTRWNIYWVWSVRGSVFRLQRNRGVLVLTRNF